MCGAGDGRAAVSPEHSGLARFISWRGLWYGSPFGGYKASGNGQGGAMGLEDFLKPKWYTTCPEAARDVSRWCPSRCLQFDL